MRQSFSDPRACCIIDSIYYLLHKELPRDESIKLISRESIKVIDDVLSNVIQYSDLYCAVLCMSSLLFKEHNRASSSMKTLYSNVGKTLGQLTDGDALRVVEEIGLSLNSSQKKIMRDANHKYLNSIYGITASHELIEYMSDEFVQRHCSPAEAIEVLNKFAVIVCHDERNTPALFLEAMSFLIQLQNNAAVDKYWIRAAAMELQHNWT